MCITPQQQTHQQINLSRNLSHSHSQAHNHSANPPPSSKQKTNGQKPTTKRRKVAKACLFCKRSHMTCDDSRPCSRCIKREIGHLCCDEPPSAVERSNLLSSLNSQPEPTFNPPASQPLTHHPTNLDHQPGLQDVPLHLQAASSSSSSHLMKPSELPPINTRPFLDPSISSSETPLNPMDSFNHPINPLSHLTSLFSPRLLLSPESTDSPLNHALDQSLAFFRASNGLKLFEEMGAANDIADHSENTRFESSKMTPEPKSEESLIDLNDFLNAYPGLFSDNNNGDNNHNMISVNGMLDQNGISPTAIQYDQVLSNPSDPLFNQHTFLNPQDPPHTQHPGHKEDRLEQIIRSSGLEAFDYSQSEKEITDWIETKMHEPSKGKMLTLWHEQQNLFSNVVNQQNPEDLIELEYQFKRNLITCLPILDTLPIPGCIWRRTGEIYQTNEQFSNLVGIHSFASSSILSCLTQKKKSNFIKIHQLWDTDSCLNFAEKFNRIALDEGQKAVLTSCVLHRFNEKEKVHAQKKIDKQSSTSRSPSSSSSPSPQSEKDKSGEYKKHETTKTENQIKERENSSHDSACQDDLSYGLNDTGRSMVICERINCTFSFTVRRDSFGLPCLIIGNFLPS